MESLDAFKCDSAFGYYDAVGQSHGGMEGGMEYASSPSVERLEEDTKDPTAAFFAAAATNFDDDERKKALRRERVRRFRSNMTEEERAAEKERERNRKRHYRARLRGDQVPLDDTVQFFSEEERLRRLSDLREKQRLSQARARSLRTPEQAARQREVNRIRAMVRRKGITATVSVHNYDQLQLVSSDSGEVISFEKTPTLVLGPCSEETVVPLVEQVVCPETGLPVQRSLGSCRIETQAQRDERLRKGREAVAAKRAAETPEQKAHRKMMNRLRSQQRRMQARHGQGSSATVSTSIIDPLQQYGIDLAGHLLPVATLGDAQSVSPQPGSSSVDTPFTSAVSLRSAYASMLSRLDCLEREEGQANLLAQLALLRCSYQYLLDAPEHVFTQLRDDYITDHVHSHLLAFEQFIQQRSNYFLTGDTPVFSDYTLFEEISLLSSLNVNILSELPLLAQFVNRFGKILIQQTYLFNRAAM